MSALRRLIPYYRPYRGKFALGLGCVLISTSVFSLVPTLIRHAIDGLRAGRPQQDIVRLALLVVATTLAMGVFRFVMRELLNGISRRIETDLRDDLFAHLTRLDAAWYGRYRTGELMARLTNDLSAVRMAVGPAVMYLTNTIVGGVVSLFFLLRIDPRLTVIALLPLVVLPVLMLRLGRAIHTRFDAVQEQFGVLSTRVQENASGARIVRAFRQEDAERARFDRLSEEYLTRNLRLAWVNGLTNPAFALLAGLGAAAVIGVGGTEVIRGAMTVGALVAFGLYLVNLTWPLIAIGWVTNLFQRGAASMARLVELLDAPVAIADPVTPAVLAPREGGRAIRFAGVSFAYPATEGHAPRTVLHEIDLEIAAGSVVAIVGATGSGKSTLLELIPRLHDPQQGTITLDEHPLPSLALRDLRAEIGFVPQDAMLFSETIRENLRYSGATDDAAQWGARVAALDDAIAGFPAGYETLLGERGINLSGGQKQRATIARALARRPNVVILDDALSAVDTQTEAAILSGLRGALAGRTAIIASHRVTAVRDADLIIVLHEGRIVERGTHAPLLAARGHYWELLRHQQLEDEVASVA
ncbi:MAG: ABC transporter ATP-binding protein/permease [Gemmatimonadaceae bacterium]|nr:ABC transporter ATP-binding protein/permease [Gemmatimonadaceae bacterium]